MMRKTMHGPLSATLFMAALAMGIGWAQRFPQNPTPCGQPGTFEQPKGFSVSIDKAQGAARYRLESGKLHVDRQFPGVMNDFVQACRIPGNRIIAFGDIGSTLNNIEILNGSTGTISDSIWGYTPALSPDKHWLVFRKFYPAHVEPVSPDVPAASEEYLLYDLTKDAAANRAPGVPLDDTDRVGIVIYPVVPGARPFMNTRLPANQTHIISSDSFYWAANSAAVLFADTVEDRFLLVLVYMKEAGQRALAHSVKPQDVCAAQTSTGLGVNDLTLSNGELVDTPGGLLIKARFTWNDARCPPRVLEFPAGEFTPAQVEALDQPQPAVPKPQ